MLSDAGQSGDVIGMVRRCDAFTLFFTLPATKLNFERGAAISYLGGRRGRQSVGILQVREQSPVAGERARTGAIVAVHAYIRAEV